MDMTPERWTNTCAYLDAVFGREDRHLRDLMPGAIGEGVADIAVSVSVGRLLRKGGLLTADNALGGGDWWIDDPSGDNPDRDGAAALHDLITRDAGFEAFCMPIREGVAVGMRV